MNPSQKLNTLLFVGLVLTVVRELDKQAQTQVLGADLRDGHLSARSAKIYAMAA
jgi:hypothetical protein